MIRLLTSVYAAILLYGIVGLSSCKKEEPTPNPDTFLVGTWQYSNGAECVYDAATKTAKLTKVPINNVFRFVVGEDCWRAVKSTGTAQWEYEQILRSSNGITVEYRKSTMKKKDDNTLTVDISGFGIEELKRK